MSVRLVAFGGLLALGTLALVVPLLDTRETWPDGAPRPVDPAFTAPADAMLAAVNGARSVGGGVCGGPRRWALALDTRLMAAAEGHAAELARRGRDGRDVHLGADGSIPAERIRAAGFRPSRGRENVSWASGTPAPRPAAEVVAGWMASDGHCKNLLSGDVDVAGWAVGVDQARGEVWHVLVLDRELR